MRFWVVAGLLLAALGGALLLVVGETVILVTRDESGRAYETRVWIVDDGDEQWIRGAADHAWSERIARRPVVELERRGEKVAHVAKVDSSAQRVARVRTLMAKKYGGFDSVVDWIFGHSDDLPIRLELVYAR